MKRVRFIWKIHLGEKILKRGNQITFNRGTRINCLFVPSLLSVFSEAFLSTHVAVGLGHGFAGSNQQSVDLDVLRGEQKGKDVDKRGGAMLLTIINPAMAVDK